MDGLTFVSLTNLSPFNAATDLCELFQLEPYLSKILPKLYRYQFDPVPRIQMSMMSIWNALVPDTNKAIDQYLPHIMDELTSNLTNNQWRVREACCGALQVTACG